MSVFVGIELGLFFRMAPFYLGAKLVQNLDATLRVFKQNAACAPKRSPKGFRNASAAPSRFRIDFDLNLGTFFLTSEWFSISVSLLWSWPHRFCRFHNTHRTEPDSPVPLLTIDNDLWWGPHVSCQSWCRIL